MPHAFDGAAWADNRQHRSAGIAHLFKELAHAFERLSAIEYDAPWERVRR
ncbi:hypothetical protein [Sphingomonas sp. LM7]|nr:hypothetical protein [Sphingomonas sp. LM7]